MLWNLLSDMITVVIERGRVLEETTSRYRSRIRLNNERKQDQSKSSRIKDAEQNIYCKQNSEEQKENITRPCVLNL
jgi:hypothetical protein